MADSAPPDKGSEGLDEEVNDEEWERNGNKNVADSDDSHIFGKIRVIIELYRGKVSKSAI